MYIHMYTVYRAGTDRSRAHCQWWVVCITCTMPAADWRSANAHHDSYIRSQSHILFLQRLCAR